MSFKRSTVAGAATVVALVAAATAAAAVSSTRLGATKQNHLCSAQYMWIQTSSTSASYAAPAGGRLVKWRVNGGKDAGTMQFLVWRPVGGTDYTLLYISDETTLTAKTINRVVLKPRVRVQAGDVIGLRSATKFDCAFETDAADDTYVYNNTGGVPSVGDTVHFEGGSCCTGFQFNVAAIFR